MENVYGINNSKEVLDVIKTVKEIVLDIKLNGFSLSSFVSKGLPLIAEIEKGYKDGNLIWKNEIPDATDSELKELEGIFNEIFENSNFSDIAVGSLKMTKGFINEITKSRTQVLKLERQVAILTGKVK